MADVPEEFITLTQLNCVQQCSALIQGPNPQNYYIAAALFGLYCGVLIYRSYRNYLTEMQETEKGESLNMQAEELHSYGSYLVDPPSATSTELLLPHIIEPVEIFSNTQISQHTDPETLSAVL